MSCNTTAILFLKPPETVTSPPPWAAHSFFLVENRKTEISEGHGRKEKDKRFESDDEREGSMAGLETKGSWHIKKQSEEKKQVV